MHRANYRQFLKQNHGKCRSFDILEGNNYRWEIIELVNTDMTEDDRRKKEAKFIDDEKKCIGVKCLNHNIPGRSFKQYQIDNRERLNSYHRIKYNDTNSMYKTKKQEYYKKKSVELFYCDICKVSIKKLGLKPHIKTKKHIKNLNISNNADKNTSECEKKSETSTEIEEIEV